MDSNLNKASAGGRVTAEKLRTNAINNYMLNPNYCKFCNKILMPKIKNNKAGIAALRKRKFCNSSCAASFNNKKSKKCVCGGKIPKYKDGTYRKSNLCYSCLPKGHRVNKTRSKVDRKSYLDDKSKGVLFTESKNWQSARSSIAKHARRNFNKSKIPKKCKICGYSKHVDICHIKDVCEFEQNALISDINSINNLVALCKNHHWEFDNNKLDREDFKRLLSR